MYTVVTNFSRVVTCAIAPTSTHGSGQSVNGSHRRFPSRVYGYGVDERLQVHRLIRNAHTVIAQIVCGLGDFDRFLWSRGTPC